MAPKKKKQSINAYYYFMLHIQKRHSGKQISLAEAARLAASEWERMSADQRAPFKKLANEEKARQKGSGEKFTSQGRSFADLDEEKAEKMQKLESLRQAVKERIELALMNNSLIYEEFFFIDINIFCEIYEHDDEMYYYYPAEIALSKYTLAEGISQTYHSAINPGRLRTGYVRTAQQHSNETHQLPIPPDAIGETDMSAILSGILQFLKDNCNSNSIPILYTLTDKVRIVEGVLNQLCDLKNISIDFKVFNLAELFMHLINATGPDGDRFDTPTIAQIQIEKDIYDYYSGLACDYHETTDVIQYCSLSKVKRWGFMISDYCLKFLDNIPIILGQHFPKKVNLSSCRSNVNSRCESRAESVFTNVSQKSQAKSVKSNSICSTPASSVISFPPEIQHKSQAGAIKKIHTERSHSPTESVISSITNVTINSNKEEKVFTPNPIDFPLLKDRNTDSASSIGRLEQIRRPKTQSQVVVTGAAAALLGYSTDTTATDNTWSNVMKKGRGRGIAAKFSNP